MKPTIALGIVLVASLAAAVSLAKEPPPSASVPGTAIEIYRPGRFMCKAEYIPVIIDDKEVGRIESGRFFTVRVAPGTHTVRGDQTPPAQVEVKTDQVAFVRFRYDHIGGFLMPDSRQLEIVAAQNGSGMALRMPSSRRVRSKNPSFSIFASP